MKKFVFAIVALFSMTPLSMAADYEFYGKVINNAGSTSGLTGKAVSVGVCVNYTFYDHSNEKYVHEYQIVQSNVQIVVVGDPSQDVSWYYSALYDIDNDWELCEVESTIATVGWQTDFEGVWDNAVNSGTNIISTTCGHWVGLPGGDG